jgi:hypothetical protein
VPIAALLIFLDFFVMVVGYTTVIPCIFFVLGGFIAATGVTLFFAALRIQNSVSKRDNQSEESHSLAYAMMGWAHSQESEKRHERKHGLGIRPDRTRDVHACGSWGLWPFCGSVATLHGRDSGPDRRSNSLRLGEAQGMKTSEFVHDANFAGLHFLVISQDVRDELLSVKSRLQQYLQDNSDHQMMMVIIRGINTPCHAP